MAGNLSDEQRDALLRLADGWTGIDPGSEPGYLKRRGPRGAVERVDVGWSVLLDLICAGHAHAAVRGDPVVVVISPPGRAAIGHPAAASPAPPASDAVAGRSPADAGHALAQAALFPSLGDTGAIIGATEDA